MTYNNLLQSSVIFKLCLVRRVAGCPSTSQRVDHGLQAFKHMIYRGRARGRRRGRRSYSQIVLVLVFVLVLENASTAPCAVRPIHSTAAIVNSTQDDFGGDVS